MFRDGKSMISYAHPARKSNPATAFCKGARGDGQDEVGNGSPCVNTDIAQAAQALNPGNTTTLTARLETAYPYEPRAAKVRKSIAVVSSPDARRADWAGTAFSQQYCRTDRQSHMLSRSMRFRFLLDRNVRSSSKEAKLPAANHGDWRGSRLSG